jgi:predicted methyltransferase
MPKFQVTGSLTLHFDVEVTAIDERIAESDVREMSYVKLIEGSPGVPTFEIDSITPLKKGR